MLLLPPTRGPTFAEVAAVVAVVVADVVVAVVVIAVITTVPPLTTVVMLAVVTELSTPPPTEPPGTPTDEVVGVAGASNFGAAVCTGDCAALPLGSGDEEPAPMAVDMPMMDTAAATNEAPPLAFV